MIPIWPFTSKMTSLYLLDVILAGQAMKSLRDHSTVKNLLTPHIPRGIIIYSMCT
jgi:hypothetical protein